jgi:U3 small nucleolar RNA-associated protein 21
LQSGAHRGAYKRSDADKDLDDDDDDGKKGTKPFEPRRQLNLRGGANSIWNIADKSYGMDGGGGNGKNSSVTPRAPAHVGPVAAVCCDGANKIVCTAGVVDGACRVWNFSTQKLIAEMQTGVGVVKATLHSPGSLLACAGTDKIVRVLDVAGMRRVRSLRGAKTSVVSMQFSSDGRWIVGAVDDGAVLVWDVPAARLLQTMRMSAGSRVVGVSLSPSMDVLATVHEGRRGVYLWANAAMYAPGAAGAASAAARGKSLLGSVGEEEEDDDRVRQLSENESDDDDDVDARNAAAEKETMVDLPRLHAELSDAGEILLGASDADADAADADDGARAATRAAKKKAAADPGTVNRPAPTPIVPGMATMALLPRSQWHNLLHLEEIKERSKPIAPPEKPEEAPFFLPTIASLEGGTDPVFAIDDDYTKRGLGGRGKGEAEDGDDGGAAAGPARSRILTTGGDAAAGDVEGVLLRLLRRGKALEEKEEAERDGAERGERGGKKRGGGGGKKKNAAKTKDAAAAAADAAGPYRELTSHLRKCGPSTLDAEIRALGPWDVATMTDADADELADVLEFFAFEIPSGRNFELTHALLTHFLRVHGGAIASRESLRVRAERVRGAARQAWEGLDALMQEVRCALGFFGGAHGG